MLRLPLMPNPLMPRVPSHGNRHKSFKQLQKEREEIIEEYEAELDKCFFWQIAKKNELKKRLTFLYDGLKDIKDDAESERIESKSW